MQYNEALRIRPTLAGVHNNWGNVLQALGRPQEAIARYQEALRIWPNNARAHGNLGNALQAMGRYEEAVAQYREALRVEPSAAAVHNNGTCPGRIGTLAGGGPAFPGGPEDQGRTGLAALDTRRDLRGLRSTGKWGLPPRPHLRRRVLPERVADHPVLNYGS